ncbi:MAG: FkbM family methyltransferase [Myxococcales bacterium]|jgi:FkbM family methyltransferase
MDERQIRLHTGELGPFEGLESDRVVFGTYRRTNRWSPLLVELIAGPLLGGGGTLLDVGANIGLVTIPVLERTGARALCFEPAPDNHALLQRNLARHGLADRAEVHPVALAETAGQLPLRLSPDNSGDHRLSPGAGAQAGTVRVPTARLDDVLAGRELPRPVVMKVDTQGAEARVLAGAEQTVAQVDHLIVEYWPAGLRRMGDRVARLHELLRAMPHGVVLQQDRLPRELAPVDEVLQWLSFIPDDGSDEGFFDLLFSRSPTL